MMEAIAERQPLKTPAGKELPDPPLQNGDRLTSTEFLRRHEAMPQLKKAELLEGIVFMGSPVSSVHGEPDNLLQLLFGYFASFSQQSARACTNTTVILNPDDTIQPDALLRKTDGPCQPGEDNLLHGPPELVAEIALSSVAYDLHLKREVCRRASVREYMVWEIHSNSIHWWVLEDDEYRPLPVKENCVESRMFPGLKLDVEAMKAGKHQEALAVLREALEPKDEEAESKGQE